MGGAELSRSSRRATSPCFTQPGNFFPRGPAGSSLGPSVNHLRALSLGTNRTPSSARGGQKGEEVRDASHFDPWELFRYWPLFPIKPAGPGHGALSIRCKKISKEPRNMAFSSADSGCNFRNHGCLLAHVSTRENRGGGGMHRADELNWAGLDRCAAAAKNHRRVPGPGGCLATHVGMEGQERETRAMTREGAAPRSYICRQRKGSN